MEFVRENNKVRFLSTEGISYDIWDKLLKRINYLGYAIPDIDALKSYFDRGCLLNEDQTVEVLRVFGEEHETLSYSEDMIERDNLNAKKVFGVTDDLKFAGYILLDGDMLNFSYEGYMRDIDHRDIKDAMDEYGDEYDDAMIQFINYGNIRLNFAGFELCKKPTLKQRRTLAEFIRKNPEMHVDIANTEGYVIKKFSYQMAYPSDVLKDIDDYFDSIEV